MTCEDCGQEIEIGDWPFCPHGRSALSTVPDDVPGGFWAENGFDEPRQFYSRSAHRKALEAEGLQLRHDHRGPLDKVCSRWVAVDLDAAKALVSRGQRVTVPAADAAPISVSDGETFRVSDLDRDDGQLADRHASDRRGLAHADPVGAGAAENP